MTVAAVAVSRSTSYANLMVCFNSQTAVGACMQIARKQLVPFPWLKLSNSSNQLTTNAVFTRANGDGPWRLSLARQVSP